MRLGLGEKEVESDQIDWQSMSRVKIVGEPPRNKAMVRAVWQTMRQ